MGNNLKDDIDALKWVSSNSNVSVPNMIHELFDKDITHSVVVDKEYIKDEMLNFL